MRTAPFRTVNQSRRTLRREITELKIAIRREELLLSFLANGRRTYRWRGVVHAFGPKDRIGLWRQRDVLRRELALGIAYHRLQTLKRGAVELLPDKQTSKPRIKHDRRH